MDLDELVENAVEHARERAVRNNLFWCIVFDIFYAIIAITSVVLFFTTIFSENISNEYILSVLGGEAFFILFMLIHSGYFLIHLICYGIGYGALCLIFGVWLKWAPISNHLALACLFVIITIYAVVEFLRELGWTFFWRESC